MENHISPVTSPSENGIGLITTLLFTLIGLITDAPGWLKIAALVVGIIAGIVTIFKGILDIRDKLKEK